MEEIFLFCRDRRSMVIFSRFARRNPPFFLGLEVSTLGSRFFLFFRPSGHFFPLVTSASEHFLPRAGPRTLRTLFSLRPPLAPRAPGVGFLRRRQALFPSNSPKKFVCSFFFIESSGVPLYSLCLIIPEAIFAAKRLFPKFSSSMIAWLLSFLLSTLTKKFLFFFKKKISSSEEDVFPFPFSC